MFNNAQYRGNTHKLLSFSIKKKNIFLKQCGIIMNCLNTKEEKREQSKMSIQFRFVGCACDFISFIFQQKFRVLYWMWRKSENLLFITVFMNRKAKRGFLWIEKLFSGLFIGNITIQVFRMSIWSQGCG